MRNNAVRNLIATALLAALMGILQITGVGIIPIPPAGVTVLPIPIIIGTLACGLYYGLFLAAEFGVISIVMAYRTPMALSVCFMNPLVSVLPRLLIPVVVYLVSKTAKKRTVRAALCGAAGSLANTVFVLGAVCLLYGPTFAQVMGKGALAAAFTLGAVSGLPEAAVAVIVTIAVDRALSAMKFAGE